MEEDEGGIMKQHESMEGVDDAGWIPLTANDRGRSGARDCFGQIRVKQQGGKLILV